MSERELPQWLINVDLKKGEREEEIANDRFISEILQKHEEGKPYFAALGEAQRFWRSNNFMAIQLFGEAGSREEGCIGHMGDSSVFLQEEFRSQWDHWIIQGGKLHKKGKTVSSAEQRVFAFVYRMIDSEGMFFVQFHADGDSPEIYDEDRDIEQVAQAQAITKQLISGSKEEK